MDYIDISEPNWFGRKVLFLPLLPCEKYYSKYITNLTERRNQVLYIRLTLNYGGARP